MSEEASLDEKLDWILEAIADLIKAVRSLSEAEADHRDNLDDYGKEIAVMKQHYEIVKRSTTGARQKSVLKDILKGKRGGKIGNLSAEERSLYGL